MTIAGFLTLIGSQRGFRLFTHGWLAATMAWAGQNAPGKEPTGAPGATQPELPSKLKESYPEWDRKPLTREEMKKYGLILAEIFRSVAPARQREFFSEFERLRYMSSRERQCRLRSADFKKSYSSTERRLLSRYLAATSRKKT